MMIVFLGPDGSGKSSVIQGLKERLGETFNVIETFHLKLPLGKRANPTPTTTNPYQKPLYPPLLSLVKLFYFIGIYQMGYWLNYKRIHSRHSLIIMDRYYHDLLADPERYRYGGSIQWAIAASGFIPEPDCFILLDAPSEVIQKRKSEVSPLETEKQRKAYLGLSKKIKNAIVIDTSCPLPDVVWLVEKVVLERL